MKSRVFLLAGAVIILATIGVISAQPKRVFVPSGSMKPSLGVNTSISVRGYNNFSQVKRGDIIVHRRLDKASGGMIDSVKRVVALPGDKVKLSGTTFSINGRPLPHVLKSRVGKVAVYQETNGATTYMVQYGDNSVPSPAFSGVVPKGQLFCLGDNRDNAYDSRYTGSVPFNDVIGKQIP